MSCSSLDNYNNEVRQRSLIRFVKGLIPRVYFYLKFSFIRYIARRMGGGNRRWCDDAIFVST